MKEGAEERARQPRADPVGGGRVLRQPDEALLVARGQLRDKALEVDAVVDAASAHALRSGLEAVRRAARDGETLPRLHLVRTVGHEECDASFEHLDDFVFVFVEVGRRTLAGGDRDVGDERRTVVDGRADDVPALTFVRDVEAISGLHPNVAKIILTALRSTSEKCPSAPNAVTTMAICEPPCSRRRCRSSANTGRTR